LRERKWEREPDTKRTILKSWQLIMILSFTRKTNALIFWRYITSYLNALQYMYCLPYRDLQKSFKMRKGGTWFTIHIKTRIVGPRFRFVEYIFLYANKTFILINTSYLENCVTTNFTWTRLQHSFLCMYIYRYFNFFCLLVQIVLCFDIKTFKLVNVYYV
jgi:hypothetical protein